MLAPLARHMYMHILSLIFFTLRQLKKLENARQPAPLVNLALRCAHPLHDSLPLLPLSGQHCCVLSVGVCFASPPALLLTGLQLLLLQAPHAGSPEEHP